MKKIFSVIVLFCLLVVLGGPAQAMNKTDRQLINALLDRYAQAYQTGGVEDLTSLYAARATIAGRQYTRAEIRNLYSGYFASRQQNLRSISIVSRDSFHQTTNGEFSGAIKLRVSYGIGDTPKIRTVDTEINLTLSRTNLSATRMVSNYDFVIVASSGHKLN